MTAADVKFSWQQYIQTATTQSPATTYALAIDNDINNFEIVGPLGVALHGSQPVFFLPTSLSNAVPGLPIQSMKYWTEHPELAAVHPLGTGPFEFVSSTPGVGGTTSPPSPIIGGRHRHFAL